MFYPSCNQVSKVSDTTTAQASRGKDIQGIPWDRLQFTREKYRETRLQQYKNYENLLQSHDDLEKECKSVEKGGNFYHFRYNTRSVKSTIVHFQLRNLVWATSKHDVYLMHNFSVMHWSPLTCKSTEVLNLAGPIVPPFEVHLHLSSLFLSLCSHVFLPLILTFRFLKSSTDD
jgi:hypothetical protein